jgi:hypothetical protein
VTERSDTVARAAEAYRALADQAESVEDEWQYVNDLVGAYLPSIRALAEGPDLTDEQVGAIEEAIAEIEAIEDPHRAIDWLSTFPHVVALAAGGDVDVAVFGAADVGGPGETYDEPGGDEDSPFRLLLRRDR